MKAATSFAILALSGVVLWAVYPHAQATTKPQPVPHTPYRAELAMEEVRFNEMRVKNDPQGAIGVRQLASAYLTYAREHDSAEYAIKAEAAAKQSLSIRRVGNAGAAIVWADALLEQHRFSEAKSACEEALKIDPHADSALRTMADISFELGEYDAATSFVTSHPELVKDPSGLALLARQSEIHGHLDEAQSYLQQAVDQAESKYELPATTVSWFHVKLGDFLARNGKLEESQRQYETALTLVPTSWKGLAGASRLAALQGNWAGVLEYGQRLNQVAPMTDVVGLMQDAATNLGRPEDAKRFEKQIEAMNASTISAGTGPHPNNQKGHTHDRMFCLYLANHGKMLDLAQHAATHDLAARKDIYAYDTYGWVTYLWAKSRGDRASMVEANQALDKALATDSKDAWLHYHKGVVEDALGHKDAARTHLWEALKLNPNFGVHEVADAKKILASN